MESKSTNKNMKKKANNNSNKNSKKIINKKNKTKELLKKYLKYIILVTVSLLLLLVGAFKFGFLESFIVILILDIIVFLIIRKKGEKTTVKEKLKTLLIVCFGCGILLLLAFCAFIGYIVVTAPKFSPSLLYNKESTIIYYGDNEEMAKIGDSGIRENVTYDDLSQSLIDAIIATEDSRYFEHSGVDLPRFLKASISQVLGGGGGGASTLTMQVSKNAVTSTEDEGIQGIIRKFTDIYISVFKIETHYTKEEILEFYVNSNNLGGNVRGVQTASKYYFGKDVSELNLSEAAMLAGMFQSPNGYNPYKQTEACEKRRKNVLYLMLRHGYITQEEYDIAVELTVPEIVIEQDTDEENYQSFIDTVVQEVISRTGKDPYVTPMKIYTTMDKDIQDNMNSVFSGETYKWVDDKIQAGSVVLDVNTGEIKAIGSGRNRTGANLLNYATGISRQVGSTAKPLYDYGPYMEYNNGSTYSVFTDEPYAYSDGKELRNWDYKYEGVNTLHEALKLSRNIPAVKVFAAVKNNNIKEFVTNLGLSPQIDSTGYINQSHALGGYDGESPLSMAAAYAAFSNGGYYIEPHSFTKIEFLESDEVYEVKPIKRKAMSESTAYMITKILEDTSSYAVGMNVNGVNYCAKTGTTNLDSETISGNNLPKNAIRDRWIMSYNEKYAISLWYGYDMLSSDYYLTMSKSDHKYLFKAIAKAVYTEKSSWNKPSNVVKATVEKGLPEAMLASEFTPDNMKMTAYFKKGFEPTETSKRYAQLDNVTNLKYENGKISWDPIATPSFIDRTYLESIYDKIFTDKETMLKEVDEIMEYNEKNIGTIIYEVYSKDDAGNLTLITTTSNTSIDYNQIGTNKIVVKTSYTIFKDNISSGSELEFTVSVITSELNGASTINLNVGDTYIEPTNPIIVLENGINDISGKANISYIVIRNSDNSVLSDISAINTLLEGSYTIKYTIEYGSYKNTLSKIINITKPVVTDPNLTDPNLNPTT